MEFLLVKILPISFLMSVVFCDNYDVTFEVYKEPLNIAGFGQVRNPYELAFDNGAVGVSLNSIYCQFMRLSFLEGLVQSTLSY